MKKLILFVLPMLVSVAAHAQTVNQDTLAKYNKKEEQLKVFNQIGRDAHFSHAQNEKFNQVSMVYTNQALTILGNKTSGRREKIQSLRKVGEEYMAKIKTFISSDQLDLIKGEREKYHFLKRFLAKS